MRRERGANDICADYGTVASERKDTHQESCEGHDGSLTVPAISTLATGSGSRPKRSYCMSSRKMGGSETKFVRGVYGAGKSHFLYVIEDRARKAGWLTAHVECKADGVQMDRFETLYPAICRRLRIGSNGREDGYRADSGCSRRMVGEPVQGRWCEAVRRNGRIGRRRFGYTDSWSADCYEPTFLPPSRRR